MRESESYQPVDALFEALTEWEPGSLTPEQLVDNGAVKIGRTIVGQERTDLEHLAEGEIEYDKEHFEELEQLDEESVRPILHDMREEEWRD